MAYKTKQNKIIFVVVGVPSWTAIYFNTQYFV